MFYIDGFGPCLDGNMEISIAGWPGPDEGTAVVATHTLWTGNYRPVYWFGGYIYGETFIELTADPSSGFAGLGNCETPSQSFVICCDQLGVMGILTDGYWVGPHVCEFVACCFDDGTCLVEVDWVCNDLGGSRQEDSGCSCDPSPCLYACCLADNSCVVVTEADCTGAFHPGEFACTPDLCTAPAVKETSWGSIKTLYK